MIHHALLSVMFLHDTCEALAPTYLSLLYTEMNICFQWMKQIDYKQFHTKESSYGQTLRIITDLNLVHSPLDVRTVSTFLRIALETIMLSHFLKYIK